MKPLILLLLFVLAAGCNQGHQQDVGDIPFDQAMDGPEFKLCGHESSTKQYYVRGSSLLPAGYKGEKRALEKAVLEQYAFPVSASENGYVTIRFVVNCRGESGRFRVEQMDFNYQPVRFDPGLVQQLLEITRKLDGWIPVGRDGRTYDFYQYLTFKVRNGQIEKILP
ncbi:MAG: hypothetical protein KDD19_05010 [Phaeodactylibacter sp.]|nr:hypothetical protein [Phaeodactylibacter sp.]MCB9051626.1 hypothetical protein [Lewinellaceae bacterium]